MRGPQPEGDPASELMRSAGQRNPGRGGRALLLGAPRLADGAAQFRHGDFNSASRELPSSRPHWRRFRIRPSLRPGCASSWRPRPAHSGRAGPREHARACEDCESIRDASRCPRPAKFQRLRPAPSELRRPTRAARTSRPARRLREPWARPARSPPPAARTRHAMADVIQALRSHSCKLLRESTRGADAGPAITTAVARPVL